MNPTQHISNHVNKIVFSAAVVSGPSPPQKRPADTASAVSGILLLYENV